MHSGGEGAWQLYLTNFDYVLTPPGRFDRAESAFCPDGKLPLVPVLRTFGATPNGDRCCIHIHNVFPYCYVEYHGELVPNAVLPYIQKLGHALNAALAMSMNQPTREMQLVVAIHLCKGIPFYGYVEESHYYLKISYVDPGMRSRIAMLLESGKVLGTVFQPMEAHVQYHLQWMLDYNLSGCDYMVLDRVVLRCDSRIAQDTYAALEGDSQAHNILNRRWMREAHKSASAASEPLVPSLRGLYAHERSRREKLGLDSTPMPSSTISREDTTNNAWVAASRHADRLAERIDRDAESEVRNVPNMERYVLNAYDTPELFHPNGLDIVASPDQQGLSARMFDLDVHQSQRKSHAKPETDSVDQSPVSTPSATQVKIPSPHPLLPPPTYPPPKASYIPDQVRTTASSPPRKRSKAAHRCLDQHISSKKWWTFTIPAPTAQEVLESFTHFSTPEVEYPPALYSNEEDVPVHSREYANKVIAQSSRTLKRLAPFQHWPERKGEQVDHAKGIRWWQHADSPPKLTDVKAWLAQRPVGATPKAMPSSQMPLSTSSSAQTTEIDVGRQHMTTLALHAVIPTRGDLVPDPKQDAILAIAYILMQDADADATHAYTYDTGIVYVTQEPKVRLGLACTVHLVDNELALLDMLVDIVRTLDPEILTAYDLERDSWAFVAERAQYNYSYDLLHELGRARRRAGGTTSVDRWTAARASTLRVQGRILINIWRIMQSEVALTMYSLENVVSHVLNRRTPHYTHSTLTSWLHSQRPADKARALTYVLRRVHLALELLDKSEMLYRTAEFARMYGIDFFSVLTRGSQFRVESVLLRITKLQSYIMPSPNREQVAQQNAAECIPLVLEPQSDFYRDPVLVLDFQSLYPSMMIAYNLCYTTCLGRVTPFQGTYKLGYTEHTAAPGALRRLSEHLDIMPNGMMFVKKNVRESILARMLSEVLAARVMIKDAMRTPNVNKALARRYQAQQLSLKLLANVTYGYTGATASGRMPCVEIADSIVQCGRETLERAMAQIEGTAEWGARVLYGDTDSLFVSLPGKSKQDAFRIGNDIAQKITSANPEPVRLNFEKVYHPCILVAKKRYVGYKWETFTQVRPVLDVKGLEIIRRDGCLALQRMQEASIRLLFDTQDLSLVKRYCQRQWSKIYAGHVSPLHLIISKAIRLGSYIGTLPPGAALATRALMRDDQNVPHMNERLPYLIQFGLPSSKLADLAISPHQLIKHPQTRIHAEYYVRRVIAPPIARIFNLIGVDVHAWIDEMPRMRSMNRARSVGSSNFASEICILCGNPTTQNLCQDCVRNPEQALARATQELRVAERRQEAMHLQCTACADHGEMERPLCESIECPIAYARAKNDALVQKNSDRLMAMNNLTRSVEDPWVW
ncbi:DNA-directed DNA polymerase [Malassezia yamatoensis]|uniref:DNA polymerase n=1 Tax=Malassezia yamatoensis TaxID=253288 RepID=A0AAJ5YNY1_9BASI|nr:DNA-directed DNA polymerase [Malassezia yamatoensis]